MDLQAEGNIGKQADRRFVLRVFTESEQALLAAAVEPNRLLWSLWSAKEAVFKIEAKRNPATLFAHRNFEVTPNNPDLSEGLVRYQDRSYRVCWSHHANYVHAWSPPDFPGSTTSILVEKLAGPESAAVRAMASQLLAQHGLPGCTVSGRPPMVLQGGIEVSIGISLSHDGDWGAVAIAIEHHANTLSAPP